MEDKDRFERIRETLGDHCGIVELARVDESDAMRWVASPLRKSKPQKWTPTPPANWSTPSAPT
jgi:hypothetical protein